MAGPGIAGAILLPFGNVLVVSGGTAEVYDPDTGNWAVTGPGAPGTSSGSILSTLLPSGKVLVISSHEGRLYDSVTGKWMVTKSPFDGSAERAMILLPSGKVLYIGGLLAKLYDPNTGTWRFTDHPYDKGDVAATLPSGKVLLFGEKGAQLYDPEAEKWVVTGSLLPPRRRCTATVLPSGKVLAAGGLRAGGNTILDSAELYDPETAKWTTTGSMSVGRNGHTATLLQAGKVLVIGGWSGSEDMPTDCAEIYDPATGQWSETDSLPSVRSWHSATLLMSGKVLVAGGEGDFGVKQVSAELYDPQKRDSRSRPMPSLPATGATRWFWGSLSGSFPVPLQIATRGPEHHVIKIVEKETGSLVVKLFVRAGEAAEISVPVGVFQIKYAAGTKWYGESRLFGPETIYASINKDFEFTEEGEKVKGHRLELWSQSAGNVQIITIPPEKF